MKKLIVLIESLSEKEQQRLADLLTPVIQSRKDYLDFALVQIPADLAALRKMEGARNPLVKLQVIAKRDNKTFTKQVELDQLNKDLTAAREKIDGQCKDGWRINGHQVQREKLDKIHRKTKETFASQY